MRVFYDCEFSEAGNTKPIIPISLGMVREDGEQLYICFKGFVAADCNEWVRENVLPLLPPRHDAAWLTQEEARRRIVAFCGDRPQLWANCGAYDHVVLCQLFGAMVNLPKGWPYWTHDLQYLMEVTGTKKADLPDQVGNEHDALADAQFLKQCWDFIAGEALHPSLPDDTLTDVTDRRLVATDAPQLLDVLP